MSVTKFLSSMTIHGYPRILSSRRFATKLVWTIICLSFSVIFLLLIISRARAYLDYEVFVSIENKIEQPMDFPALTICNSLLLGTHETSPVVTKLGGKTCGNVSKYPELKQGCKMFMTSVRGSITFDRKMQRPFPYNFKEPKSVTKCFTYNKNPILKQGIDNGGLRMLLYFNKSEVTNTMQNTYILDERVGLSVKIHDQSVDMVFPSHDLFLQSGMKTDITLRKIEYRRLKAPYTSKCVNNDRKVERLFGRYSITNCHGACFFDQVWAKCKDIPPLFRYLVPWRSFNHSTAESINCANSFQATSFDRSLCNCRPKCRDTAYTQMVQSIKWPTALQMKDLRSALANSTFRNSFQNLSDEELRDSFVNLNVRFADQNKQIVKEQAVYTLGSLISELGGLMGLFMGASCISLIEVLLLFLTSMKKFLNRNKEVQDIKIV